VAWSQLAPQSALAAEPVPPLVVFAAPAEAPAPVLGARDTLVRQARLHSAAFLDLSPAAPTAPTAPGLLRRGIEAYEGLRLDDALAALSAGLDEASASGGAGLTREELADLLLYRGLTHNQRGAPALGWDDLVRAAVVDDTRILDPLRFPPRTVEAFQRALERVRAQPRGELVVHAPAGCTTLVDGRAQQSPPSLPLGAHFLRVECAGLSPWSSQVVLAAPRQEVTATPVAVQLPGEAEVRALARARGAARLLWCHAEVASGAGAAPVLWLTLLDSASGKTLSAAAVALTPGGGAGEDVDSAVAGLFAHGSGPRAVPQVKVVTRTVRARPRWYAQPWLWGLIGAGVATAVLIPLLDDSGGNGVRVLVKLP